MAVDIDGILEAIGEFGPYQRRVYFLLCLPVIFVGASSLSYIFLAAVPKYRCYVHGCDRKAEDNPSYNEPFLNFTIPKKNDKDTFESCLEFARSDFNFSSCTPEDFSSVIEPCQHGLVFDHSTYHSTIITEFNLTCSDGWEASADQSIYFAGMLVGTLCFGIISDWFGRRKTILTSIVLMSISGVTIALIPNKFSFHVMRFMNAFSAAGVFQTAFVLGLEFVGPRKRVMIGIIGEYFFALGEVILGLLAWVLKTWRMLQLVISVPVVCFIFYYWVVPESVRWLQAKGRHAKVVATLEQVAKANKTTIPLHLLRHQDVEVRNEESSDDLSVLLNLQQKVTLCDLFRSPVMIVRTLFMIIIWVITTLSYYGLSFHSSNLVMDAGASSPYVNFICTALAEIPGYTIAWLGMVHCGRRWSLILSLILSGVACAVSGFVGGLYLLIVFLFGKCFITSAFAIIYVYTAEIFPTNLRNTILGTCSMFARMGGMLAPFSTSLSQIYPPLPLLLYGGISLLSSLLALVMPESRNTKLPDTIAEAVNLGVTPLRIVRSISTNDDETEKLLSAANDTHSESDQDATS